MNKKIKAVILLIFITYGCIGISYALELTFQDTSAGVNITPAFSLSLDKTNIDFGYVYPGKKQILHEGTYFNEITCRSNQGRRWNLTAHLLSPLRHLGRDMQIKPENFRWKVFHYDGEGQVINEYQFNNFATVTGLIYTSAGTDNLGKEVRLKFQYELEVPDNVLAGTYVTQILFTLTETP